LGAPSNQDVRTAITGGTGFVGKHLGALLSSQGQQVCALGNVSSTDDKSAGFRFDRVFEVDVTDESTLQAALQEWQPDSVYHLAAVTSLSEAAEHERAAFDVNVWGTHNVLKTTTSLSPMPRVLNVSSSQVYGSACDGAIDETQPIHPEGIYAATKAMAESWSGTYRHQVAVITVRSFNHTGPGQGSQFVLSYLAMRIAEIEAELSMPVIRVGNLDVERDFTDVRDIVRAYALLMEHGDAGEVYNVCSGQYYLLSDLLDLLLSLTDRKITVEVDLSRTRKNDPRRVWGDHAKLTERTGWQPTISIQQTLQDMLNHWRQVVMCADKELAKSV